MRVAIARALLRKAPFIILDEPTAALDSTGRMVTVRLIQKLRETHTILVVTHDEDLANAADRIISFSKESGAVGLSLGPD